MNIHLAPADPVGWASRFSAEAAVVRRGVTAATDIEHVGSTALGIESKDVVDLIVGVDPSVHEQVVAELQGLGHRFEGSRLTGDDERHSWLARLVDGGRITVLHVVDAGGGEWRRRTGFRDALRDHEFLRTEYVALKRAVASTTDDWSEYTAGKSAFVQGVLERLRP